MNALQLSLFPQPRNWWPSFIRTAMREANASGGNFSWPYQYNNPFYSFKDRLLSKHGIFLGYNIQRIVLRCNRCVGTGNFLYWKTDQYGCQEFEWCLSCNGSGVYAIRYHVLERYNLFGDIYHKPIHIANIKRYGALGPLIKGKIKHSSVGYYRAGICFLLLLAVFDWNNFGINFRQYTKDVVDFLRRKFNRALNKFATSFAEAYKYQFHYDQFGGLPF